MSTLSVVIAVTLAACPAGANTGESGRVILLGARWCAPCMAEYRALGELVKAAEPDRLVLAWIDAPLPVPPALRGQLDVMPPEQARALALAVGGAGFGLPMAVRMPATGGQCRVWRAPLHPRQMPALKGLC